MRSSRKAFSSLAIIGRGPSPWWVVPSLGWWSWVLSIRKLAEQARGSKSISLRESSAADGNKYRDPQADILKSVRDLGTLSPKQGC